MPALRLAADELPLSLQSLGEFPHSGSLAQWSHLSLPFRGTEKNRGFVNDLFGQLSSGSGRLTKPSIALLQLGRWIHVEISKN